MGIRKSGREELASRSGLDSCAGDGDVAGVASARGNPRQPSSSDIRTSARGSCGDREKAISSGPRYGEVSTDAAESKNLRVRGHPKRENGEILLVSKRRRNVARRNGRKTPQAVMLT